MYNNTSYVQIMCTGKSGKSHKAKNSKTASGGSKEGSSSTSSEQQAGPSSSEQRDSSHTSQKGITGINQENLKKKILCIHEQSYIILHICTSTQRCTYTISKMFLFYRESPG